MKRKLIGWMERQCIYPKLGNCFICTSHPRNEHGYPKIHRDGKQTKVSRFIFAQLFGEIPPKMEVCHKCDTPACINPEHLFLGTHLDNMLDRSSKGRNNTPSHFGTKNPRVKLSEKQVLDILNDKRKHSHIALEYGINVTTIYDIKNGRSWKELTGICAVS